VIRFLLLEKIKVQKPSGKATETRKFRESATERHIYTKACIKKLKSFLNKLILSRRPMLVLSFPWVALFRVLFPLEQNKTKSPRTYRKLLNNLW